MPCYKPPNVPTTETHIADPRWPTHHLTGQSVAVNNESDRPERMPSVVSVGIVTAALGFLVLAIAAITSVPEPAVAVAGVAAVVGLVLVAIGGGLRTAWEVLKSVF